jgi:hypothetical protein
MAILTPNVNATSSQTLPLQVPGWPLAEVPREGKINIFPETNGPAQIQVAQKQAGVQGDSVV